MGRKRPYMRIVRNKEAPMRLSRRGFLASSGAAVAAQALPKMAARTGGRRILTLVYDKRLGMMRAVERVVR